MISIACMHLQSVFKLKVPFSNPSLISKAVTVEMEGKNVEPIRVLSFTFKVIGIHKWDECSGEVHQPLSV